MTTNNPPHNPFDAMLINVIRMLRSAGLLSGYMAGRLASNVLARLCSVVILGILGVNFFLFLNIALGLWLGSLWGGSPALGFLLLAGMYLLLMLAYLCVRAWVEGRVRDAVAHQSNHLAERSAQHLEGILGGEELELKSTNFLQRTVTYDDLCKREEMELRTLTKYMDAVRFDALYLKNHYKDVAVDIVEQQVTTKYPILSYLKPVLGLMRPNRSVGSSTSFSQRRKDPKAYARRSSALDSYMPVLKLVVGIVRPVLWSFVVSRGQNMLASMLGLNKGKRKG